MNTGVNSIYVGNIPEKIPSELSKDDSASSVNTFKLTHIDKNARMRDHKGALNRLTEAMIINMARNITNPSPSLTLTIASMDAKATPVPFG